MRIADKFNKGRVVFSLEVFPPKKESGVETIYNTLEQLSDIKPDYISVTYGAGGNGGVQQSCEIAANIKLKYGIEPVSHLTCVNNTKDEIIKVLADFKTKGIQNLLALRGDINPDIPRKTDFVYASDLVSFVKTYDKSFGVAGACYPEVHMEAKNEVDDIFNLKKKVDAGADNLVSQLFFDNEVFYRFIERAKIAGINVPIQAGIMPVTNKKQIERMVSMCGASFPSKFSRVIQRYGDNPQALRDAGIAYAVDQIVDLIANGVDGIHLYTMNNPYVAKTIAKSIEKLL
ncbi:MAG TPA: methylenetetrahydrofolate reductase [NAD(P)H] [Clostridiales bacterium]|nr:methylenetetrahydrofolate reductase [NAD(P)H] [Clostridiales bacterium]